MQLAYIFSAFVSMYSCWTHIHTLRWFQKKMIQSISINSLSAHTRIYACACVQHHFDSLCIKVGFAFYFITIAVGRFSLQFSFFDRSIDHEFILPVSSAYIATVLLTNIARKEKIKINIILFNPQKMLIYIQAERYINFSSVVSVQICFLLLLLLLIF